MKKPKLIEGLSRLERNEWISFRKYVLMYCKKSSDNYRLLDQLFRMRNSLATYSEIDQIKNPLFKGMSSKSFLNLMSRIFGWFEEWLIWNEQKKDRIASDIQLVKIYNRKGIYELADKTFRRVEKKLLDQRALDLKKHHDMYHLYHNHYLSDNPVKYAHQGDLLDKVARLQLRHFKEQALLYVSEMHNLTKGRGFDYALGIELLMRLESQIDNTETSYVLKLIIDIGANLSRDAFLELKELVLSKQIKEDSDLYIIATLYMVSYSMRLWNANKIKDPQLVLEAHDFGLESGVILKTGSFPVLRFMTLVSMLGMIKASAKAYEFVDKWIHHVDSDDPEAIRALAYAQLRFHERKYEDILTLLIGKRFMIDAGKLRSLALELISLYMSRKSNYTLLVNRLSNFRRALKTYSNRKSNEVYRMYFNFTKVLDLLIKRDFVKMTIRIDNYSPIIFKEWLIEEIKAGHT
ncbi:MAG: hypothetical protein AAGA77_15360 [Bacteroidota bacterium]